MLTPIAPKNRIPEKTVRYVKLKTVLFGGRFSDPNAMSTEPQFILFGNSHIIALLIVAAACFFLWPLSRIVLRREWQKNVSWILVVVMIVELGGKVVCYRLYGMPWERLLPLQICDANALLCVLMLLMRSYRIYEVAYFWAMAGSVSAMLTPDLRFDFPHPIFLFFYLGHALTVIAVLYATFVYAYQPRFRSVGIALLATALYAAVMMPLNYILGTNYLYLTAKPTAPSLLDYMGPWPWYLLGLGVMCAVACLVCYAPFYVVRKFQGKSVKAKG